MTLKDLERRGAELRANFARGAITEEEFRAGMNALRFQDAQNRWWMLGAQSNKWYQFDGTRWLPGDPPEIPSSLPLAAPDLISTPPPDFVPQYPAPVPTPDPQPQIAYTPTQPATAYAQTQYSSAVVDDMTRFSPPESVTQVIRRAPRRRSSATALTPLWLGIAAFMLIALFGALLYGIENFVPGKPLSSFVARLSGANTPGVLAPPTGLPAPVIAMITAGDQAFAQGQIDASIAQYQKAAQAAPGSATPLVRLARTYAYRGQVQDAISRARQAVKISPDDAEANAQLCRALTWDTQVNDAIKVCEGAVKLDSKNVNAHAFLAEAYLHTQRIADAKNQALLATQLAPNNAEAHRAQAWVMTLSGQKDQAQAEWNQTIALEGNLFFRYYEAAEVTRVFYNDTAGAIPNYQRALTLYNAYLPGIIRLGGALVETNQAAAAIPHLRRAATLAPNNPEILANLGLAYARTSQCPQAIPYYEQALKIDANNSVAQRGMNECKTGSSPGAAPAQPVPTVPLIAPTSVPSAQ